MWAFVTEAEAQPRVAVCQCRQQCLSAIPQRLKHDIRRKILSMTQKNDRDQYFQSLIRVDQIPPSSYKVTYHVESMRTPVCLRAFKIIHSLTKQGVYRLWKLLAAGQAPIDRPAELTDDPRPGLPGPSSAPPEAPLPLGGPLLHRCRCRRKCLDQLTTMQFHYFRTRLATLHRRVDRDGYFQELIHVTPIARKGLHANERAFRATYDLPLGTSKMPVCRTAFMYMYGLSEKRLRRLCFLMYHSV